MSKNKGFSLTSSKRYSLALYELATEAKVLSKVEENSSGLLNLISTNKDFSNFVKDPTIGQDTLINIITKISEISKMEILLKNFLIFLIKKRSLFKEASNYQS